jgi:uncharacterized protein with PQ loop repeat
MYHLYLRKRGKKKLEPVPATTFGKRLLDATVLVVGIVGPIMTLPQILLIYGTHNATGISVLTWFGWALLDTPWIIYGIVHREPPLILTYMLWFVMNAIVGIGAILYG